MIKHESRNQAKGTGKRDGFVMAITGEKEKIHPPSRYSLEFSAGIEFLIYAENLAKTSSPAVLDSGLRAANLGYLWKRREISIMAWQHPPQFLQCSGVSTTIPLPNQLHVLI